jgi:hypothetical protein
MHLMRCLHCLPGEAMMSLMAGALGTHGHASGAESHSARSGSRALMHREVGLELYDTWRCQSPARRWSSCLRHVATPEPSCTGDGPRAVRHAVTPEPSPAWWWAQCHKVRCDAGALHTERRVWNRWDTWRH